MRCFILSRVSTEHQRGNFSIQVQRTLLPRIADQLNCEYTRTDIFDLDVSSTTYDHEKWDEVKRAVASGRYRDGYAIFGAIDRYHRDKWEWYSLMSYLRQFNIRIALPDTERADYKPSEKIPIKIIDTDKFEDVIQLIFKVEEAENYKKTFRKKVKLAFAHAREIGIDIRGTSVPSYGHTWKSDKKTVVDGRAYGTWVIDPIEAKVVKKIITSDLKAVKMAQWLNQHGYKTKRGRHWDSTAVTRTRAQLRTCGKMRNLQGDIIDARNVEPIVSYQQYQVCHGRRGHMVRPISHTTRRYAGVGIVKCGFCHDAGDEVNMTRARWASGTVEQARLYCQRKKFKAGPKRCQASGRGVNHYMIMDLIIDDLLKHLGDEKVLKRAYRDYLKALVNPDLQNAIENTKYQLTQVDRKLHNLTAAVADGYDRELAMAELSRLKSSKEELASKLTVLQLPIAQKDSLPSMAEIRRIYRELVKERRDYVDNQTLNELLETFIDAAYYYVDHVDVVYGLFGTVRLAVPLDALGHRKINLEELKHSQGVKPSELAKRYGVTKEAIYYHLRKNK